VDGDRQEDRCGTDAPIPAGLRALSSSSFEPLSALNPARRYLEQRRVGFDSVGGAYRDRTDGLRLAKPALSQLS
jgi:hypothetical protein